MSTVRHCSTCTCGRMEFWWSDRGPVAVDIKDAEELTEVILNCLLDHSYDRTDTGIPDSPEGLPMLLRDQLVTAIDKYASAIVPDWHNHTLYLNESVKEELHDIIFKIIEEYWIKEEPS